MSSLRRLLLAGGSGAFTGRSRLLFGGADGSTTFTDDSGRAWTAFGNAQIDTSLGDHRGLFDGSGDYIQTPDTANLRFGASDFAIFFTMRFNSKTGFQTIASKGYINAHATNVGWLIQTGNGDGKLNIYGTTASGATLLASETAAGTINNSQDYAMEVGASGGVFYIKRDGVTVSTPNTSLNLNNNTHELVIGGGTSTGINGLWFNGWLKNWIIP